MNMINSLKEETITTRIIGKRSKVKNIKTTDFIKEMYYKCSERTVEHVIVMILRLYQLLKLISSKTFLRYFCINIITSPLYYMPSSRSGLVI